MFFFRINMNKKKFTYILIFNIVAGGVNSN